MLPSLYDIFKIAQQTIISLQGQCFTRRPLNVLTRNNLVHSMD